MTLLDAPAFNEARARRNRIVLWSSVCSLVLLFILWWLAAGRPVDWPWRWNNHLFGRAAARRFMNDLKKNDLQAAYGVWINDKDWQQHPGRHRLYPFSGPPGNGLSGAVIARLVPIPIPAELAPPRLIIVVLLSSIPPILPPAASRLASTTLLTINANVSSILTVFLALVSINPHPLLRAQSNPSRAGTCLDSCKSVF